ncbi:MAG: beta-lactamase family protein [Nannocystaceae bacterium]|nr:beta-lactamase family protein [Nannocystaceae bacterium]
MHRGLLALGLLAACGDGPAPAQPVAHDDAPAVTPRPWTCLQQAEALPQADRTVAKALCAELRVLDVPGGVVAVAEQGAVTLRFAAGVRCAGDTTPVTPQTAFRLGSITKSMTAALAFALAERGAVDLDARLAPARLASLGVDPSLSRVSLRQLLDHRAGLPDVLPDAALAALPPTQRLAALVGHPFVAPDVTWSYSNGGYVLAGAWLEAVAGTAWPEAITAEVFTPLGMTGARARPRTDDDVACGHLPGADGPQPFDVVTDFERFAFGLQATAPAGAVIATADDVLRFAAALSRAAGPQAPRWAATMLAAVRQQAQPTDRHPDERYAAGLEVVQREDVLLLQHHGNTGDFAALVAWRPDLGNAVVVLGNAGTPLSATFAAALSRIGVVPAASEAQPWPLARYAGRYGDGADALELAVDGDALTLHGAGVHARLQPLDHHGFIEAGSARTWWFVVRDDRVVALRGPGRYAPRQPLTAPTPPAAP